MKKYTFNGLARNITVLETYEFVSKKHTFYVEIIKDHSTDQNEITAWIWERSYGIKEMMFGTSIPNGKGRASINALESFTEMVIANFPKYADGYMANRLEEDGCRGK